MVGNIYESLPSYHPTVTEREMCQCKWLAHVKLSRIIILISTVLFTVPLVTHYYLSKVYI